VSSSATRPRPGTIVRSRAPRRRCAPARPGRGRDLVLGGRATCGRLAPVALHPARAARGDPAAARARACAARWGAQTAARERSVAAPARREPARGEPAPAGRERQPQAGAGNRLRPATRRQHWRMTHAASAGAVAWVRAVSTLRASSSIVVANAVTASRAPSSPHPATYAIDSPLTSNPTLAAAT
jgi:hypothetical protein